MENLPSGCKGFLSQAHDFWAKSFLARKGGADPTSKRNPARRRTVA